MGNPMGSVFGGLITSAVQDIPAAVQGAIDRIAWNLVLSEYSLEDLDDAWTTSGLRPPSAAGVAVVSDNPGVLYVYNRVEGEWTPLERRPERDAGTVKFTWQPGYFRSAVADVSWDFSAPPQEYSIKRQSLAPIPGDTTEGVMYDPFVVAGSITADGCQMACSRSIAADSANGATATFSWRAERTFS